jgi:hypothetical protein
LTSCGALRPAAIPRPRKRQRAGPRLLGLRAPCTAVRKNPWLRAFYQRLRADGKLPKVALVAAMHKLLLAIYSVAAHRKPFVPILNAAGVAP